jgi:hypothetical protein
MNSDGSLPLERRMRDNAQKHCLLFAPCFDARNPGFLQMAFIVQYYNVRSSAFLQFPPVRDTHEVCNVLCSRADSFRNGATRPIHQVPHSLINRRTVVGEGPCPSTLLLKWPGVS